MNYITISKEKGEMDFGVNCSIVDLTHDEFNELRIMTMVAIGQAERMYSNHNSPKAHEALTQPNNPK